MLQKIVILFKNPLYRLKFVITDKDSFSKEAVSRDLSQVCISIVITDKLRDGTMDVSAAKKMAESSVSGKTPQKKQNTVQ